MKAIEKLVQPPAAAFLSTATFIGLLVDLVAGWRYVSSLVSRFFPLVANEKLYMLFLGVVIILGSSWATVLIARRLLDKKRGVPESRNFSGMQGRIRLCVRLLKACQQPSMLLLAAERTAHLSKTSFEINRLLRVRWTQ